MQVPVGTTTDLHPTHRSSQRNGSPTLAYLEGRETLTRAAITTDPEDLAERLAELAGGPRRAAWLLRQALRHIDRLAGARAAGRHV